MAFSPWHEIIGGPNPTHCDLGNSDYYFHSSQLSVSLLGHSSGTILRSCPLAGNFELWRIGLAFLPLIRSLT
jgi:hypothetical protein